MRSASSIALVAALCSLSFAQYQCPLATTGQDAAALSYAFAIQDLLTNYYDSQNFSNTDLFVPTASVSASAVDLSSNFLGLQTQATIGRDAIAALGNMRPNCQYNYPPTVENGTMILIENAFRLEGMSTTRVCSQNRNNPLTHYSKSVRRLHRSGRLCRIADIGLPRGAPGRRARHSRRLSSLLHDWHSLQCQ